MHYLYKPLCGSPAWPIAVDVGSWSWNWILRVPAQLTKDKLLLHHIDTLAKINVKIDQCELPTFHWLSKLHKYPYKSRFISNSSHCSTTILSKHITSALTAVKDLVCKYSETASSNSSVNYFWSIKTLPRSSKSYYCVTCRVLKYLLSTF